VGSDGAFHALSQTLTGLAAGSTVHFRVVATNSGGSTFGTDRMFTTTGAAGPGPPIIPSILPVMSGLELMPTAFGAEVTGASAEPARPRGSRVTFSLSQAATVTLTVQRRAAGRRVGGSCRRPTARNRGRRRCSRLITVPGSFTVAGRAGSNAFHFTGRLNGRGLKPRRYKLTGTPSANGRLGAAVSAPFRITRR
jgi:hypothetical protein